MRLSTITVLLPFLLMANSVVSQTCPEECVRYLLHDFSGPRIVRLVKELLAPDAPLAPKSRIQVGGNSYDLTATKKALVRNALKKGLSPDTVQVILDSAGVLPTDDDLPQDTTEFSTTTMFDVDEDNRSDPATDLPTTTSAASTDPDEDRTETIATTTTLEVDTTETISASTTEGPLDLQRRTGKQLPEATHDDPVSTAPPSVDEEAGSTEADTITPPRYNIRTTSEGDVVLDVNGTQLKMPDELPKITQVVRDKDLLMMILRELKSVGVPVEYQPGRNGGDVSVGPLSHPTTPIGSEVMTIDGSPAKITVFVIPFSFELPGAEGSLSNLLNSKPDLSYHVLSLLAANHVNANFDLHRKLLSNVFFAAPLNARRTGFANANPHRSPTYPVQVGPIPHAFPIGWEPFQWEVFLNTVPVGAALQSLEDQNIQCPPHITSIILDKMVRDADKIQTLRRGNDVSMMLSSRRYYLPEDAPFLAQALKESFVAAELVRDALLRVGIESTKGERGLQVRLPLRKNCLLHGLPTFRLFKYKIVHHDDGSVDVLADPSVFSLPRDRHPVQQALETRRLLPLELVDALNNSGVPATMNFLSQEIVVDKDPYKLTFPVKMSAGAPARLRIYTQGRPGSMVFVVEVNDRRLELPRDIDKLNELIREGKLDALRIVELFKQRTFVTSHFDTSKGRHIIILNGKPIEIIHSAMLSGSSSSSTPDTGTDVNRHTG